MGIRQGYSQIGHGLIRLVLCTGGCWLLSGCVISVDRPEWTEVVKTVPVRLHVEPIRKVARIRYMFESSFWQQGESGGLALELKALLKTDYNIHFPRKVTEFVSREREVNSHRGCTWSR